MKVRCKHCFLINLGDCYSAITIVVNVNQVFEAVDLNNGSIEISRKGVYVKMPKIQFDKYFVPVK